MGVFKKYNVILLVVISALLNSSTFCAPSKAVKRTLNNDMEDALHNFLDNYYENFIKNTKYEEELLRSGRTQKSVDIYETMQGDQPAGGNLQPPATNFTGNVSDADFLQAARNRLTSIEDEIGTKENWIQLLKMNILQGVGRADANITVGESRFPPLNLTQLFPNNNETNPIEDLISKKIRTFYPSCSVPDAAEQEFRNEDKLMNLFFNYTSDTQGSKIATATLRLHLIHLQNSTSGHTRSKNCTTTSSEEEKLLRISIYWYMKPQRNKRRGKKRLCDSRVVSENAKYIELNVVNAIKAWSKDQNLGLAVQVEDQDGRSLKAEKYFKGPTCLPHPEPSPQSSWTTPDTRINFSDYWEEIQHRPFLVIYYCSPPLTFAPWDSL